VNGETVGSVTETSPGLAIDAGASGSIYEITPSNATGGTFTPSNYTITYENGALTVLPLQQAGSDETPVLVNPWVPTVVLVKVPPQLLTLAPPVVEAPVLAVAPVEIPVVLPAPVPTAQATAPAPAIYVAPHRPRKQDRN
jgi:hypothetical protein